VHTPDAGYTDLEANQDVATYDWWS
jgi:hypothetical protein